MALINSNNFYNSVRGAMGLFSGTNKARKPEDDTDVESTLLPEFESTLTNEEIIKLTGEWTAAHDTYIKDIKQQQKDNVNYWIGKQYNELQTAGTKKPLVDNLIFEAVETFLPIATRSNPQANVFANGTEQGDQISKVVTNALLYQAERQKLRMKLKGVARNWNLYLIGCAKIVWDSRENDIDTKVILPTNLILDPNAEIEIGGIYRGEFLGEKKKCTGGKLLKMFPKQRPVIAQACDSKWGTKLNYVEWWTPTDVFFTINSQVLGKYKNPHWNYDGQTEVVDPITKDVTMEDVEGKNHFSQPQIPYIFLTIFNLGKRPHDETSLITQNISMQDIINRRYQQIDRNVDSQNNGIVLSGKYFTKEQAAEAATQLSRGNPLWVPEGDVNAAYKRDQAPSISPDVFKQLQDARDELRNIFGTSGSTPEGLEGQKSVRGKIMINQMDSSRIGGGITEYIEQVASTIYNWYVQMMYVYYTEQHSFSIVGTKAQELMTLINTDFMDIKLHIVVKDGSLIPKDPLTKRNEAMDLWSAGAIAPIPFYAALDYPNPYESAKELVQWQMIQKGALPPQVMFPDLEQPMGAMGQVPPNTVNPTEANRELVGNEVKPVQPTVDKQSSQIIKQIPLQ